MDVRLPRHGRGATLIEIAIAIAIVALMIMLGLPSFREWIQNSQIRTAAESVSSGLQTARNEAVRRNANVQFTLTAPGAVGGTGWQIALVNTGEVLQSAPGGEGSGNVTIAPTPVDAVAITFNGYGRTPANGLNTDGSSLLTQLDFDSTAIDAADTRELRIVVTTGGQIRMCDPAVTSDGDTRKC
ncbi:MAG: GspH/FimT family pseudopilin [Candidatus Nitricoxidivorans perseverans]|uniref:Type II secretion system protein H n=1 Tax=Candidatus Nitricoxidivorans perseverans TaxID=2975601 RepID=A0AA49FMY7_9PROT|nr:MAG: GspH/FimT family pseudopilin [Candidatus Nitricoxidivorans perseverans]